ncbi:hypothetical protein OGAPHI_007220 [Ogataea philodendri]|uniref:Folylpolyglutamate synthase n=1 Tax=Ogataea philodendri TaxID=1378263 RepID=A0A9P8NUL4_9ASCO|nr:uncharacterized protein OGAPHI_007220 [Ogataea philodendri]KAH3660015.1 hypothetical protein OGAPHI_007220 [Ogataea philodendri]
MIKRTYKDAINALNSLQSNFATIEAARLTAGAKNAVLIPEMIEWTRRIGYKPQDLNRLNVIHVTGTKGKGSTCAFATSILNQYRSPVQVPGAKITKIGLYTSPHLKSVRERLIINGKPISEALFTKYFFDIWDRLNSTSSDLDKFPNMGPGVKPAYFRFLTLLSFHAFSSENVDTAVYEVGVGGEYDSTNIFESPTACGITSLGIDHIAVLGNTLEQIAWNKAGIFKPGAACFSVEQPEEALNVIKQRAVEKKVASFEVVEQRPDLAEVKLGINGDFQRQNASLAVQLVKAHLEKLGVEIGACDVLPEEFVTGLEQASWPGRCQIIKDDKREDLTWYIDGSHTTESIASGTAWFASVTNDTNRKVLLFNQQTRNVESLLEELHLQMQKSGKKFDNVIFSTNVTFSDGKYSDDLVSINVSQEKVDTMEMQKQMADIWNKFSKESRKHLFHDIQTSVNFIRTLEGPLDVLVCGSLHLVGGFLLVLDSSK